MRLSPTAAPPSVEPIAPREYLAQLPVEYAPDPAVLQLPRGPERRTAVASHLREREQAALATVSDELDSLRETGVLEQWRPLRNTGLVHAVARPGKEQAAQQALRGLQLLGDVVSAADASSQRAPRGSESPPAAPDTAWQLDVIRARDAWARGARGQGVTIGFVDSGALTSHPELAGRQRGGGDASARPWIDLLDAEARVRDTYGHGTAVTSVAIGATTGSAPDATYIAARAFGKAPGGRAGNLATKLEGIGWMLAPTTPDGRAADAAAAPDVVNTSFGEYAERMGIFRIALQALEDAGVMVVAAAGNTGRRGPDHVLAPARYDSVLAVGMTDRAGVVDPGSAHTSPSIPSGRSKPDVVVPGVGVRAGTIDGTDGYSASSGTSLASAVAAGAAAVVLSAAPSLLPAQVRDVLRRTAIDVDQPGHDPRAGAGLVDLEAAVRLARTLEQEAR